MGVRRDTWLGQSGLKVIRVVIGSYFCGMALGLPIGFDPFLMFGLLLPGDLGQVVGAAILFGLAVGFILGYALRPVSLILAGFLISSATGSLLVSADMASVGALWQSIAFGAAVLLSYGALRPHEMHKAALLPVRKARGTVAREIKDGVAPRRVRPRGKQGKSERPDELVKAFAPLIAPTERMIGVAKPAPKPVAPRRVALREEPVDEDVDNIFVNL